MGHKYVWQTKGWPHFKWDTLALMSLLGEARRVQGEVLANAALVGLETKADLLIEETFTTSAIEGENLDRNSIRSSVARKLGLETANLPKEQRHITGLVEILMDATGNYRTPLTKDRLYSWQAALFPTGYSSLQKIKTGGWRTTKEPMQVISGPMGREKIHFEAPPSQNVSAEMTAFIKWFQSPPQNLDGLIRAGLVHFWFITIHPFEDGNGRIARAITDMAIAQDEKIGVRLYSLSSQIVKERKSYYEILERSQKGTLDLTKWLEWFLKIYTNALKSSKEIIQRTLEAAYFWQRHQHIEFNDRQRKVIQKLLQGIDGSLTNKKYVSYTKTSRESAKRDLADLEEKNILIRNKGKGRSISYTLKK